MSESSNFFPRPPAVSDAQWLEFLLGESKLSEVSAPMMPATDIQNQFVGSNGRAALVEASTFCRRMLDVAASLATPMGPESRLLDFGVGWGRLYRVLLNHVRPQNLIGVDIDQKCIDLCRAAMPYGSFVKLEPSTPLTAVGQGFDAVFAYSVFSHLAEHAFRQCLSNFRGVLKDGGIVAFTTLKPAHLEVWNQQSLSGDPWYTGYLKAAGFDHAVFREKLASGQFLYVPTGGGDLRDGSFYGEAIVTRGYLERAANEMGYQVRVYETEDALPQAFCVLQKGPLR